MKKSKIDFNDLYGNAEELGELLGLTTRAVQKLVSNGVIKRKVRGQYHIKNCTHSYILHLKKTQKGNRVVNESASMEEERQREITARANKFEIENDIKLGKLLDKQLVVQSVAALITEIRTTLESIPSKTAPKLVNVKTAAKARTILLSEVRKIIKSGADKLADISDSE